MIPLTTTHWTEIAENTGSESKKHYIPAGQHKCQMCQTYNDPRLIVVRIPNHNGFWICVTCGKDYLMPLLLQFFTLEQLEGEEGHLSKYPKNPYEKKESDKPAQLPANHPKMLQQKQNVVE